MQSPPTLVEQEPLSLTQYCIQTSATFFGKLRFLFAVVVLAPLVMPASWPVCGFDHGDVEHVLQTLWLVAIHGIFSLPRHRLDIIELRDEESSKGMCLC